MFRNRSTAASIRNIFLWKLISSLSLSFQYSSLYYRSFVSFSIVAPLYYVNISQREKLSFKEKKRLESSYESEDRKTFSTSISHHGTKAIYTFLYISSIISISIWLIHNRDDIEIHCFFPLGSPNFLSFFLSFYFHWRSNCEESGGLFLPAGRNCLFRKRKKWRHLRVPGEQRGTIFA